MQIGGPDSTIRSINASGYPLMRRTWDAANAGCWLLEVACVQLHLHGRAGEGEGPAFSSVVGEWQMRLLLALGRRLKCYPTADSGF